jgi:hypothetical protein
VAAAVDGIGSGRHDKGVRQQQSTAAAVKDVPFFDY